MRIIRYTDYILLEPSRFFNEIRDESIIDTLKFIIPTLLILPMFLWIPNLDKYYKFFFEDWVFSMHKQIYVLALSSLTLQILLTSMFFHIGLKIIGSKKQYKQTFKIVAYPTIYAYMFMTPFHILLQENKLEIASDPLILSIKYLAILLIGLWALSIEIHGASRLHELSVLKTLFAFIITIIIGTFTGIFIGGLLYLRFINI